MMRVTLIIILLFLTISPEQAISEPLRNPEFDWISNSRIFLLDTYAYPFFPKIEFDAEQMAETMDAMDANALRVGTSGKYCMIPGTGFVTHPELDNRDILQECIDACKPRGIRVIAYIATGHAIPTELIENQRPGWAQWVNPEGGIHRFRNQAGDVTTVCWNTPYREAFLDLVRRVVNEYDVDALYFDRWDPTYFYPQPKVCYCPGCRDGFKKASGLNLPYRPKTSDYTPSERETIKAFGEWRNEVLVDVFLETKRIIKSHRDLPMIYNINHASRVATEERRIMDGSDAFLYERGRSMLERAEGVSLAVSHGLAVWPYVGGYDGWQRVTHNGLELSQEIFTTIAFGGAPILAQFFFWVNDPETVGRKIVGDAFHILEENKNHIGGFDPLPYLAVVWNDTDPPGRPVRTGYWRTDARNCSLGAFSAGIYGHIQTASILQGDLDHPEFLDRYKVLYLPDICHLTDSQIAAVEEFVKKGGGLVMTYGTSLYDENSERRSDFALGELARVRHAQPDEELRRRIDQNLSFGGVWDLYMRVRPDGNVINTPFSQNLIPAFLYEPVEALPGSETAADIVAGADSEPIFPGLVVSRYGRGKVAYIPAALDAAYLQTHIRQFADFLKDVIEYVSPDGLPYEIEAPSSLIANMFVGVGGDKRVLHLVNWTGCKLERIQQNVYYIPPIENVRIKLAIPKGKTVTAVKPFVPAGLDYRTEGGILYIDLARIDNYQALVVEME
ncbi:beta-galactosidase trimerization domain-containing protein [candidate division KSB1 bacterium]